MEELTVRPAVPGDAPEICRLLNAVDLVEIGREETDLHEVAADLDHPEAGLEENSWLAFREGELVGYGLMWDDSGAERIDMDQYIRPGHQDAGELLLDLMEAQAVRRAARNGAAQAVVHMHLNVRPTLDPAVLVDRGWHTVRRYHALTRALSTSVDLVPEPRQGLALRDCAQESDRRLAHQLIEETFAEHFDHQKRSYEQWLADRGAHIDWSLVWIASLPGTGDVAVTVTRNDRESTGWISYLGVRKEFRGRGIAGHLLRHAFGVYAGLGRDTIGLGVDTDNETGALGLYKAHGMTTHFAVNTWEVTLPVQP